MDESSGQLEAWFAEVEKYVPAMWERLPDLELYMDQVLTFMNKQLEPFTPDGERLLTPSMINNYVKDNVLPRPVRKKYSRGHLAMLLMICSLKAVLSLPEIAQLLRGLTDGKDISDYYPAFEQVHSDALKEVAARISAAPAKDDDSLYQTAMQLSLEANARRIAAARILKSLEDKSADKETDAKEKDGKEPREKDKDKEKGKAKD